MSKHRGAARAALLAFTAFTAASAAATCANAADRPAMPVKAPAPKPAPASWTQFYLGGGIGINAQIGQTLVTAGGAIGAAFSVEGFQGANLGLTATAGFDFQVSPLFVLGGFVDYDWSHEDTTLAVNRSAARFSATALRLDGGWTIGGRGGVLLGTDVLSLWPRRLHPDAVNNWGIASTGFALQEPSLTLGRLHLRWGDRVSAGEQRFAPRRIPPHLPGPRHHGRCRQRPGLVERRYGACRQAHRGLPVRGRAWLRPPRRPRRRRGRGPRHGPVSMAPPGSAPTLSQGGCNEVPGALRWMLPASAGRISAAPSWRASTTSCSPPGWPACSDHSTWRTTAARSSRSG